MVSLGKLISSDFVIGKLLVWGRAILGVVVLLIRRPSRETARVSRLILKVTPQYTMVAPQRLLKLYELVEDVNGRDLEGDLVECGTWNGGSAAMMGAACRDGTRLLKGRRLWLFDSFQGLPSPSQQDGGQIRWLFFPGWCKGDPAMVTRIFQELGIPLESTRIVPGWFDDTLRDAAVERIALLHIDADLYQSVRTVLEALYDKVVAGGFIAVDDYGRWSGCRRAIDDFFTARGIDGIIMKKVDDSGVFFEKPRRPS